MPNRRESELHKLRLRVAELEDDLATEREKTARLSAFIVRRLQTQPGNHWISCLPIPVPERSAP